LQRGRRQPARSRNVRHVRAPKRVEEHSRGFLILRRHVVARDRLDERLVFPDGPDVVVDVELVEQRFEIRQEPAVTIDEHEPHRVHVDVVGLRGQIVLIAREAVADCDDGFAALLEACELGCYLLQLAQARPGHRVKVENDRLDPLVVSRGTQRVDDVAHESFLQRRSLRSSERALQRVAGELVDEHAARLNDERCRSRYEDALAEGADDEQHE
jgi:hypothetical protein